MHNMFITKRIFQTAVLFSLLLLIVGCNDNTIIEKEQVVRPVKIYRIGNGEGSKTIEYSGKISAASEIQMAFEVPGRLVEFPVRDGLIVNKGDILGSLDPRDYKAAFDAKSAQLEAAKADYGRARSLYKTNTIPKKELDAHKRNFRVSEANFKVAKKQLEDTVLRAPFTGRVTKTLMDNYQNVQAKQPVLVFSDDSNLEIVVTIPEIDFVKRNPGWDMDKVTELLKPGITISALPGSRLPARLTEVSTSADPVTRTFEATFSFEKPEELSVYPGMTAKISLTDPSSLVNDYTIMVPANAVRSDENGRANVWVIDPETMKVSLRIVALGDMTGSEVIVLSGLKPGELVAVSGVHLLRSGMTVKKYSN